MIDDIYDIDDMNTNQIHKGYYNKKFKITLDRFYELIETTNPSFKKRRYRILDIDQEFELNDVIEIRFYVYYNGIRGKQYSVKISDVQKKKILSILEQNNFIKE